MIDGMLIVESNAETPQQVGAYRTWYKQIHVPEVLAIDGFASARLFAPLDGDSLVSIFELDADVGTAKVNLPRGAKVGRDVASRRHAAEPATFRALFHLVRSKRVTTPATSIPEAPFWDEVRP